MAHASLSPASAESGRTPGRNRSGSPISSGTTLTILWINTRKLRFPRDWALFGQGQRCLAFYCPPAHILGFRCPCGRSPASRMRNQLRATRAEMREPGLHATSVTRQRSLPVETYFPPRRGQRPRRCRRNPSRARYAGHLACPTWSACRRSGAARNSPSRRYPGYFCRAGAVAPDTSGPRYKWLRPRYKK
jgi:hypothetical protein